MRQSSQLGAREQQGEIEKPQTIDNASDKRKRDARLCDNLGNDRVLGLREQGTEGGCGKGEREIMGTGSGVGARLAPRSRPGRGVADGAREVEGVADSHQIGECRLHRAHHR